MKDTPETTTLTIAKQGEVLSGYRFDQTTIELHFKEQLVSCPKEEIEELSPTEVSGGCFD